MSITASATGGVSRARIGLGAPRLAAVLRARRADVAVSVIST
jgi:hypothetical protein